MNEKLDNALKKLLSSDVNVALKYCESLICFKRYKNISDFENNFQHHFPPNSCNKSWTTDRICVYCRDCCKNKDALLCFKCFANGNHENHNFEFVISKLGKCYCGNSKFICGNAPCELHDDDALDGDSVRFKKAVLEFCGSLFNIIFKWLSGDGIFLQKEFVIALEWLGGFAKLNDCVRDSLARSMIFTEFVDITIREFSIFCPKQMESLLSFYELFVHNDLLCSELNRVILHRTCDILNMIHNDKIFPRESLHRKFSDFLGNAIDCCNLCTILERKCCFSSCLVGTIAMTLYFAEEYQINTKKDRFTICMKILDVFKIADSKQIHAEEVQDFFYQLMNLFLGRSFYYELSIYRKRDCTKITKYDRFALLLCRLYSFLFESVNKFRLNYESIDSFFYHYFTDINGNTLNLKDVVDLSVNEKMFSSEYTLPVLSLLWTVLIRDIQGIESHISKCFKSENLTKDEKLKKLSFLPLRVMALKYSASVDMNSNPSLFMEMNFITSPESLFYNFIPMFSLIQICFGYADDKESFINTIASIFGCFDSSVTQRSITLFVWMIITLITCEDSLLYNFSEILKGKILITYKESSDFNSVSQYKQFFPTGLLYNETLSKIFKRESDKIVLNDVGIRSVNVFAPWVIPSEYSSIINNSKKGLNIPKIIDHKILRFDNVIQSKTLFGIFLYGLILSKHDSQLRSVGDVLLHLRASIENIEPLEKFSSKIPRSTIEVQDLKELIERIPSTLSEILNLNIKFDQYQEFNLLDTMNMVCQKCSSSQYKSHRNREILNSVNKCRDEFLNNHSVPLDEDEKSHSCFVCKQGTNIVYPVLAVETKAPQSLLTIFGLTDEKPEFSAYTFLLSMYPFHYRCYMSNTQGSKEFYSPDKLLKNIIIPVIPKFSVNLGECDLDSMHKFFALFPDSEDKTRIIFDSFVCELVLIEGRLRNNQEPPYCKLFFLRNFFNNIWSFHNLKILEFRRPESRPPVWDLIYDTLSLSKGSLTREDISFPFSLYEDKLKTTEQAYSFYRIASAFEQICIRSVDRLTDIDHFVRIRMTDVPRHVLKGFVYPKLPVNFHDFAKPPYNIDIGDYSQPYGICLVSGALMSTELFNGCYEKIRKCLELANVPTTFVLFISGQHAGRVAFTTLQFNIVKNVKSIYTDEFDQEDIGLTRGSVLTLNESRYKSYLDSFLTGEWTNILRKKQEE